MDADKLRFRCKLCNWALDVPLPMSYRSKLVIAQHVYSNHPGVNDSCLDLQSDTRNREQMELEILEDWYMLKDPRTAY
jgi:hypothetical protein